MYIRTDISYQLEYLDLENDIPFKIIDGDTIVFLRDKVHLKFFIIDLNSEVLVFGRKCPFLQDNIITG